MWQGIVVGMDILNSWVFQSIQAQFSYPTLDLCNQSHPCVLVGRDRGSGGIIITFATIHWHQVHYRLTLMQIKSHLPILAAALSSSQPYPSDPFPFPPPSDLHILTPLPFSSSFWRHSDSQIPYSHKSPVQKTSPRKQWLESKQIADQSPRVRYLFEKSFQWVVSLGFGSFGTRFWSLRGWMRGRGRWRVLIYGLWVVRWEWKRRYILGWDAKNLVRQRYYYRER